MKTETWCRLRLFFCAACAALSACAGGGGAHGLNPPAITAPGSSAGAKATAPLAIKIVIPRTTSGNSRKPAYVGAGTQSVEVVVTPSGGTPSPAELITCSAGTCSGSVGAPVGSDTVTVNLYDQPSGGGHLLSTGTTTVNVAAAGANQANLTFNPLVSSVSAMLSGATFNPGTASTATATVIFKDADGNTIVGPGNPVDVNGNPVTVTLASSETGGNTTTSVAPATINSLANVNATVSYTGSSIESGQLGVTTNLPALPTPAPLAYTIGPANVTKYSNGLLPGAQTWGLTTGPDGNIWFVDNANVAVGTINPATGHITLYTANITGSHLSSIVVGADGNLWFAESWNPIVGRITTNGNVTEFSAGMSHSPDYLVLGPDGAVWFTENGTKIGRIDTTGAISECGGISSSGLNIAVGADGNLWFAEVGANKIGRLTTSCGLTEFPTAPAGISTPWYIAAAPDGNLWFTAENTGYYGKITTAGTITRYSAPAGWEYGLALGPDRNLWVTDTTDGQLVRLSTTGAQTDVPLYSGAFPVFVCAGPDGNLWVTDTNADIMRVIY